jgi:sugar-specific transcriptional regulator TrmB
MNSEVLKQLGFLSGEIEVYKALLRLGPCKVSKLNQETGLHRTHIYDLLEKLREKGLVSVFIQSGKKHFKAAEPEKILSYLKEKEEKVKSVIPEFEELMKAPSEETTVELFKGKEGLKTVFQDIIKQGEDYLVFGEEGKFQKVFPIDVEKFMKRLEKNKIHEKVLVREDLRGKVLKSKNTELKYLPKEHLSPVTTVVYTNKVASFIWTPPFHAVVAKNKELADSFRSQFNALWKTAKR